MMTPEERAALVCEITTALHEAHVAPMLSDEELQWVRLAIKREAQSIELRQAVIEKTLAGLLWSLLVGFGYLLIDFAKNHGFK